MRVLRTKYVVVPEYCIATESFKMDGTTSIGKSAQSSHLSFVALIMLVVCCTVSTAVVEEKIKFLFKAIYTSATFLWNRSEFHNLCVLSRKNYPSTFQDPLQPRQPHGRQSPVFCPRHPRKSSSSCSRQAKTATTTTSHIWIRPSRAPCTCTRRPATGGTTIADATTKEAAAAIPTIATACPQGG